ncbi:MAG: ECF-type sigma factor [Planctomycetota bacterium]
MTTDAHDLTLLLNQGSAGDRAAAERAFEHVYAKLKAMAGGPSGPGRSGDTLHPTALVHEVYGKLFSGSPGSWSDRRHFFAVAAKAMRSIVVDHARASLAQKRGGGWSRVAGIELVEGSASGGSGASGPGLDSITLVMLDDAMVELAELSPRQARVVELRFFAGLSVSEVAMIIGKSDRTVELDWRTARAWLRTRLGDES